MPIACTIQVRRFDTLLDALADKHGDVVAAAIPITHGLARSASWSRSLYFKIPGPFRGQEGSERALPASGNCRGARRGSVGDGPRGFCCTLSSPGQQSKPFAERSAAEAALKAGEVDYVFADGLGLSPYGSVATRRPDCCDFIDGPYLESRFFGEGIGFVVRKDDERCAGPSTSRCSAWEEGKYAELYLRFFPSAPSSRIDQG